MAIESAPRLTPFVAVRLELAKLRASVVVQASGKAAVVDMVDAYIVQLETRVAALERAHAETQK